MWNLNTSVSGLCIGILYDVKCTKTRLFNSFYLGVYFVETNEFYIPFLWFFKLK